ncbi:hypothetical protein CYMTET_34073 [Cymbomonas tetramitiformis]|nr:hypothetical protein CYMTET_34073 [Cymbomonas tetramitiformis]
MKKTLPPSPAYAWIKCNKDEDAAPCASSAASGEATYRGLPLCGCAKVMRDAGIIGVPGKYYGMPLSHMRIELLQRVEDFDTLIGNLRSLIGGR